MYHARAGIVANSHSAGELSVMEDGRRRRESARNQLNGETSCPERDRKDIGCRDGVLSWFTRVGEGESSILILAACVYLEVSNTQFEGNLNGLSGTYTAFDAEVYRTIIT
jgi:hypothetical protein